MSAHEPLVDAVIGYGEDSDGTYYWLVTECRDTGVAFVRPSRMTWMDLSQPDTRWPARDALPTTDPEDC